MLSFISRIPNDVVYGYAGRRAVRYKLLQYQLMLFGHVERLPNLDALRLSLLRQDDVKPAHFNSKPRGGQKHSWIDRVYGQAPQAAGNLRILREMILLITRYGHRLFRIMSEA